MRKNRFILVMLAVALIFGAALAGCGGGGGKANPATDFSYDLTEDGKGIVIKDYTGGSNVVIPATIEDIPVVEIGYEAFYNKGITSVYIPPSVVKIADGRLWVSEPGEFSQRGAFMFNNLKKITFSEGLKDIGAYAFSNQVFDIGRNHFPFYDAPALTGIKLPASLEHIGSGAFAYQTNLATANLPLNLKSIGGDAFNNCGLNELTIPDELTTVEIYSSCFTGCGKLPIKTRQKLKDLGYTGGF